MPDVEERLKMWATDIAAKADPVTGSEIRMMPRDSYASALNSSGQRGRALWLGAAAALVLMAGVAGLLAARQEERLEPVASVPDTALQVLAAAPADEVVELFDYEYAAQLAAADPGASQGMAGARAFESNPAELGSEGASRDDWRRELGVDPATFRASARWGVPPDSVLAIAGPFSADTISNAVRNDPEWSDLLSVDQYRGATYYSWGDDLRVYPDRPSVLGGTARRVVLVDGVLVIASSTDALRESIDRLLDGSSAWNESADLGLALADVREDGYWSSQVSVAPQREDGRPARAIALAPAAIGDDVPAIAITVVTGTESSAGDLEGGLRNAAESLVERAPATSNGTADGIEILRRETLVGVRVDFSLIGIDTSVVLSELLGAIEDVEVQG